MRIGSDEKQELITVIAETVIAHTDELTELDAAIGDGDHGHNMRRGMEALIAESGTLAEKPLGEALKAAGMQLVMKVGGASGPLYGTLLMGLGKSMPEDPSRDDLIECFGEAVEAVKARGKSDAGQKTMLDVLVPVLQGLQAGAEIDDIVQIAETARQATIPMQAERGRASFLGERSVGHVDPGARSSELMIAAAVGALKSSPGNAA